MNMTLDIPFHCALVDGILKIPVRNPDCATIKCVYDITSLISFKGEGNSKLSSELL